MHCLRLYCLYVRGDVIHSIGKIYKYKQFYYLNIKKIELYVG